MHIDQHHSCLVFSCKFYLPCSMLGWAHHLSPLSFDPDLRKRTNWNIWSRAGIGVKSFLLTFSCARINSSMVFFTNKQFSFIHLMVGPPIVVQSQTPVLRKFNGPAGFTPWGTDTDMHPCLRSQVWNNNTILPYGSDMKWMPITGQPLLFYGSYAIFSWLL